MVVVDDRSMTNVHVVDIRYISILDNKFLHALISSCIVLKELSHMLLTLTGGN